MNDLSQQKMQSNSSNRELKEMELSELKHLMACNKIEIDLDMQSEARWNPNGAIDYINSLIQFSGGVSSITLVDIKKCYENSNDDISSQYYKKWLDKGIEYLIVDGNNRIRYSIYKFLNSEIAFTYDGNSATLAQLSNLNIKQGSKFNEWDVSTQEYFNSLKIPVTIIQNMSRSLLGTYFISLNSGVPLNAPEMLNALDSQFGDMVRSQENYIKNNNIIANKNISTKRRKLYYIIAKILGVTINPSLILSIDYNTFRDQYTHPNSILNKRGDTEGESFRLFLNAMVADSKFKSKIKHPTVSLIETYAFWKGAGEPTDTIICENLMRRYIDSVTYNLKSLKDKFYWVADGENHIKYPELYNRGLEDPIFLLHRLKLLVENPMYPIPELSSFFNTIYDVVLSEAADGARKLKANKIFPLQTIQLVSRVAE